MIEQLRKAYPQMDWVPSRDPHLPNACLCPVGPRDGRLVLIVYSSYAHSEGYAARLYRLGQGTLVWGPDHGLAPEVAVEELLKKLENTVKKAQLFSSVLDHFSEDARKRLRGTGT